MTAANIISLSLSLSGLDPETIDDSQMQIKLALCCDSNTLRISFSLSTSPSLSSCLVNRNKVVKGIRGRDELVCLPQASAGTNLWKQLWKWHVANCNKINKIPCQFSFMLRSVLFSLPRGIIGFSKKYVTLWGNAGRVDCIDGFRLSWINKVW